MSTLVTQDSQQIKATKRSPEVNLMELIVSLDFLQLSTDGASQQAMFELQVTPEIIFDRA